MELPVIDSSPTKETGSLFHCNYCDTEAVRKIAQLLLSGLASACVDNTTGNLFRNPSFVAVAFRKEMVEYLTTRSESFIAESVVGGDNTTSPNQSKEVIPEHPTDIVQDFIDDFVNSKRNLFSRVSSWLSSEGREDKIDNFAQELETQNFWPQGRREAVSELLLKNVDAGSALHCTETLDAAEQLAEHRSRCKFRPVSCSNDGCNATVSALHAENHDSVCPFKVIPCEQNCEQRLTGREMDRHCVTVCPMKLVNCPFYQVGCESAFPQCTLPKHCAEFIHPRRAHAAAVAAVAAAGGGWWGGGGRREGRKKRKKK